MLQNQFNQNMASAFKGQWYDISDTEAVGRSVQYSSIPFGVAVVQGTNDNQCRLPDHGGYFATLDAAKVATVPARDRFIGLVMYHAANARCPGANLVLPVGDDDCGYLAETETASIATEGRIYCQTEVDVAQGDPVYFRHTLADNAAAPQTQQLGALRNDDDGGNAELIKGAIWMYSQEAGGLGVVNLSASTEPNNETAA